MTNTVSIEANVEEVQRSIARYGDRAIAVISRAVEATAIDVRGDIVRRIQSGPASGRTYMRGTVSHVASAPGEAPATDTGALASSISYQMKGRLAAEIESRLAYAPMLEFGTQSLMFAGGVGGPRPAWTPAAEEKGPKLRERIITGLNGIR